VSAKTMGWSTTGKSIRGLRLPATAIHAGWAFAVCLGLGISGLLHPNIAGGEEVQTATPELESAAVTVPAGTTMDVVLFENVSSGLNTMGETVQLNVIEDVVVGGRIAIAKGARIKAQISNIGQSGMMGKGGDLNFSPVSVEAVDGQWVPLDKDQMGARGAGASVGAIIGIGLFAKGRAAFVLRGTTYQVSIRRDAAVNTLNATPRPTLRQFDVQVPATVGEVKRIKFSTGKVGDDILFNIRLTPDITSLVGQGPDAVQIVKVFQDVLYAPIKAISVQRDPKDSNVLNATFGWWSVIKYAESGSTPIVLHCILSDGRVAQAQLDLTTEWKVD